MTIDLHRGPAKIYQFPTRSRPALGGSRPGENPAPNLTPHVAAACGSAWYHEAAIQDAGLASKN
ncbi:MAG: hypothetical protein QOD56_82 [Gammaproteobacteria bacterium]|jgi:hypothetical protein|nr:hypothetical protein [Gammaproteobacteria bacterium]